MRLPLFLLFVATAASSRAAEKPCARFAVGRHARPCRNNLLLTLATPRKHRAKPVPARGPAGRVDAEHAQFFRGIVRVGAKLRRWHCALAHSALDGNHAPNARTADAGGDDGIRRVKPGLGRVARMDRDGTPVGAIPAARRRWRKRAARARKCYGRPARRWRGRVAPSACACLSPALTSPR
ncbi:MAG: hypothetical protein JNL39_09855 [Opitutaceae bacterium]|nr:hypothetical protein [Opitutaceae bacterium]